MPNRHTADLHWTPELKRLLRAALAEDVGSGDVTTLATVKPRQLGTGQLIAKEKGVICGVTIAQKIWEMTDKKVLLTWHAGDGEPVVPGQVVADLQGKLRGLLTGERLALNFLQQLSGVSTLTAKIVAAAGGLSGPVICDTRKTTPLWRTLERYGVRMGGGTNHRFGLFDMILIKENHARAAGGLAEAIELCRKKSAGKLRIGAEARNMKEVKICCEAHVDLILLDNFTPARARRAIEQYRGTGIPFEISGGVTLRNIAAYARAKPDRISIGALTHSPPALDLSLQLYQA